MSYIYISSEPALLGMGLFRTLRHSSASTVTDAWTIICMAAKGSVMDHVFADRFTVAESLIKQCVHRIQRAIYP